LEWISSGNELPLLEFLSGPDFERGLHDAGVVDDARFDPGIFRFGRSNTALRGASLELIDDPLRLHAPPTAEYKHVAAERVAQCSERPALQNGEINPDLRHSFSRHNDIS
jgi:hypothetical protein